MCEQAHGNIPALQLWRSIFMDFQESSWTYSNYLSSRAHNTMYSLEQEGVAGSSSVTWVRKRKLTKVQVSPTRFCFPLFFFSHILVKSWWEYAAWSHLPAGLPITLGLPAVDTSNRSMKWYNTVNQKALAGMVSKPFTSSLLSQLSYGTTYFTVSISIERRAQYPQGISQGISQRLQMRSEGVTQNNRSLPLN